MYEILSVTEISRLLAIQPVSLEYHHQHTYTLLKACLELSILLVSTKKYFSSIFCFKQKIVQVLSMDIILIVFLLF